jgi:hypothetical protein
VKASFLRSLDSMAIACIPDCGRENEIAAGSPAFYGPAGPDSKQCVYSFVRQRRQYQSTLPRGCRKLSLERRQRASVRVTASLCPERDKSGRRRHC